MKKLHEFTVNKTVEVEETELTKDESGQEIKVTKKVSKLMPQKFFLAKPSSSQVDDADLFFGVTLSEGIKAGLLTRSLIAKRFDNDGGVLSEPDKQKIETLYASLIEKEKEHKQLSLTNNTTEED